MENAAKAESLSLPPKGLKPSPSGWRDVDVDIAPVDLMNISLITILKNCEYTSTYWS